MFGLNDFMHRKVGGLNERIVVHSSVCTAVRLFAVPNTLCVFVPYIACASNCFNKLFVYHVIIFR